MFFEKVRVSISLLEKVGVPSQVSGAFTVHSCAATAHKAVEPVQFSVAANGNSPQLSSLVQSDRQIHNGIIMASTKLVDLAFLSSTVGLLLYCLNWSHCIRGSAPALAFVQPLTGAWGPFSSLHRRCYHVDRDSVDDGFVTTNAEQVMKRINDDQCY